MKITEHQANSHTLNLQGKEHLLLVVSDVHFDSRDCHRDLLKKHFDECKARKGYIMVIGDWFDVMGGYRDPRSKAQDIRPEYLRQDRSYLDLVVEDSFNFLLPYKDNLVFMSEGNHETAIKKHRDTDILNTLVFLLRQSGSKVVKGGYSGYFNIVVQSTGTGRTATLIAYHHGYGGNSPRSKGIMKSQLDAMMWPDAEVFLSGHDHNKLHDFNTCMKRAQNGEIKHVKKHWIKTGNYKRNDRLPGVGGWAVEKGFMPKPLGGYFIELTQSRDRKKGKDNLFNTLRVYEAD